MDHTTLWLAHERIAEARHRAAEDRRGRAVRRSAGSRGLLQRIRGAR